MAEFGIDVIVDPSQATPGLDKVDRRLKRTEKSAKRLGGALRRALTLVGILAVARQVGVFADSLTNVQNRLRLVTKNTAQLNEVTKRLFDISARTRTGFSATATIFSRTALAVKDLGLSLNETLGFTEALNQAIVLSGVKAQEANAGLIQLSQGLASGTLRGDELRSVLEQLPKVADLIADELEVARGELRLLGEQGLISTKQIINAFTGIAAADLTKAFADSIPTISQGFSVLEGRIIQFIGKADEANKFSEKLARGLIFVAENLDTVAKVAIVAGAALVGPFAKAGVLFATRAVLALNAAILANPIGALVILTIAAVVAIDQFGDSIAVSADGLVSLKDVAIATWDFIVRSLEPVLKFFKEGFKDAINFITKTFDTLNVNWADVASFAKTVANRIIGHFVGLGRALKSVVNDLGLIFNDVIGEGFVKGVGTATKAVVNFAIDSLRLIKAIGKGVLEDFGLLATAVADTVDGFDIDPNSFVATFLKVGENAKNAYQSALKEDFVGDTIKILKPALKEIEDTARIISEARRKAAKDTQGEDQGLDDKAVGNVALPFAFRSIVARLGEEAEALALSNRERDIQNKLLELEAKLRAAGVTVTPVQTEILRTLLEFNAGIAEQGDLINDLNGPQEELTRRVDNLNQIFGEGEISAASFTAELQNLKVAQAELDIAQGEGGFAAGFIVGIDGMLDSVVNFTADAGIEFGNFFTGISEGFANAIGNAIVFGDSIKEALGNAARQALAGLLSGLINIGIQFVLNEIFGKKAAVSAVASTTAEATASAAALAVKTTAALTAIGTITAAVLTSNVAIATSAAAPAALVSLATAGTNAIPATAGILSTAGIAQGVAATALLADGGFVTGPGGPRDDKINARLSNGEFVMNARSTAKFRDQLEAMNDGDFSGLTLAQERMTPPNFADGGFVSARAPERLKPQLEALNRATSDEDANNQAIRDSNQSGTTSEAAPAPDINVVNVLDPSIVEDFIDSPNGEQVVINLIERNASSISQLLRG